MISFRCQVLLSGLLLLSVLPTGAEGGSFQVGVSNTRRMDESGLFQWTPKDSACASKPYKLSVYTDTHVYLIAEPKEKGNQEDGQACPVLAFHSGADGHQEAEEILLDDVAGKGTAASEDARRFLTGMVVVSKTTLQDIVDAFNQVDYDAELEYDVVMNNCATMVLQMLAHMGYFPNDSVMEYVATSLHMNNQTIHALRSSPYAEATFGKALELDDFTLLHTLTVHYVKEQKHRFLEQFR